MKTTAARTARSAAPTFRIATYNFLSGGSAQRRGHWTLLRDHVRPDLLMTQESRPPVGAEFPCASAWWHEAVTGRWGTGVFSARADVAYIDVAGFHGWVTGGEVRLPTWLTRKRVRAFSIHCPAGDGGYIRVMHRVIDAISAVRDGCDIILAGDFNVAAGFRGPDDMVKMGKNERALLERIVAELDVMPCWQTANPGVPLAQTLRWTGNRAAPYHCDGVFVPRRWKDKLIACDVITNAECDRLSDHNPVVAVFRKRGA